KTERPGVAGVSDMLAEPNCGASCCTPLLVFSHDAGFTLQLSQLLGLLRDSSDKQLTIESLADAGGGAFGHCTRRGDIDLAANAIGSLHHPFQIGACLFPCSILNGLGPGDDCRNKWFDCPDA